MGDFAKAEVHFPNVFTSNRRPWCRDKYPTVTMQYLQHSTHSAENDMIWDGEKATFKGNTKFASLHCLQNNTLFRIMTWQREEQSLRQLSIMQCQECTIGGHHCSGRCCATPLNEFTAAENPYVELACATCKQNATCLPDMKTCNGRECCVVEKVLPGSYVWFGVPEMSSPQSAVLNEHEFLHYWTQESVYGIHSFVVDMHTLIAAYRKQIANGGQVVFRCGGTLMYTSEVCYVVIVTHEGDNVHDNLPPITSPFAADDQSPRCDWSRLLNQNGHCTKKGYAQFFPHHVKVDPSSFWDHVAFAFHLPTRATLSIPQKDLIGGGPLPTKHTWCHKFRRVTDKSSEMCAEEEAEYQSYIQSIDLTGIDINELFSPIDDADGSADTVQSSHPSQANLHSRLTGERQEHLHYRRQEPVGTISIKQRFSSFERAKPLNIIHSRPVLGMKRRHVSGYTSSDSDCSSARSTCLSNWVYNSSDKGDSSDLDSSSARSETSDSDDICTEDDSDD